MSDPVPVASPWHVPLVAPWRAWLAVQAYIFVSLLLLPIFLLRVLWRSRQEPGYRAQWFERLGLLGGAHPVRAAQGQWVWLHAVSLGETRAAEPLVRALREAVPGVRLLLTHTTATGREAGRALLREGDAQAWLPWDMPWAVRLFLGATRPRLGLLMETEVWPVLAREARRLGVPLCLVNARLSEKSWRQGRRFASLLQPAARSLALVLAQTADDAARLRGLGASGVRVCGNLKFDMSPDPSLLALGRSWAAASQRAIVLAASTREGEEQALLAAWLALRACHAVPEPLAHRVPGMSGEAKAAPGGVQGQVLGMRLWIVPRHPQRFDEVVALVAASGLRVDRRSRWREGLPDAQALAADVWVGDSLGEMPAYYAAAHVACLGGSFEPLGGQNLIEAAACACPLVMGPSTFNFADAAVGSEAAGAAWRVSDWPAALALIDGLSLEARQAAAQRAQAFAAAHRGATRATVEALRAWLPDAADSGH